MKLAQTVIEKNFFVEHQGATYDVNYLSSDRYCLGLLNRTEWEIFTEDGEQLQIYSFSDDDPKKKSLITKNQQLADKLILFCIKNFDSYKG